MVAHIFARTYCSSGMVNLNAISMKLASLLHIWRMISVKNLYRVSTADLSEVAKASQQLIRQR
jgi:hypothetical protein